MHDLSRRDLLKTAASLAPLALGARWPSVMAASAAPDVQQAPNALLALSARDVVDRIRNGDLTTESYVAALLKQYEATKSLNIINAIDGPRVLEAARAVDRQRARGTAMAPASGLPFAVKDQILVAGYACTGGNGALRGHIATRNAHVVETLVRAGAIPFCMTALPDMTVPEGLMHQASSHSDPFGAPRNPYDPSRIPGGSSGGSAAALAARIVPAALGLDTNGSIRCPSAFCGVSGLRPSTWTMENALRATRRKRYDDDGVLLPPVGRLDTIGPMARTVADVAFLDAIITGGRAPAVNLRDVRIAVPSAAYWEQDPVDLGVASVIKDAFAKLRAAGCTLIEIDFNAEYRSIVGTIEQPAPAAVFAASGLDAPAQSLDTMAAWLREHAPGVTVEQMYGARRVPRGGSRVLPPREDQVAALTEALRRIAEFYRTHRVVAVAYPTVPMVAPSIRAGGPLEPWGESIMLNGQRVDEGRVIIRNLFLAPRFGSAALSIPVGLANGMPVGLELDALPGEDRGLLGVGVEVERVVGSIRSP